MCRSGGLSALVKIILQSKANVRYPGGYFLLARAYLCGEGVFVDNEKAVQYMGLAAIGGHVLARCCLGKVVVVDGRVQRALEHFKIAARAGWEKGALDEMKQLYMEGHATKDDYRESLLAFQKANSEMKSEQRDIRQAQRKSARGWILISNFAGFPRESQNHLVLNFSAPVLHGKDFACSEEDPRRNEEQEGHMIAFPWTSWGTFVNHFGGFLHRHSSRVASKSPKPC